MDKRIKLEAGEVFFNQTFGDYSAFLTLVTNETQTIGVLSHTRKETLLELIKHIQLIPDMVKCLEKIEDNEEVKELLKKLND